MVEKSKTFKRPITERDVGKRAIIFSGHAFTITKVTSELIEFKEDSKSGTKIAFPNNIRDCFIIDETKDKAIVRVWLQYKSKKRYFDTFYEKHTIELER